MTKTLLASLLTILLGTSIATADTVTVPTPETTGVSVPARGSSMRDVEADFGVPTQKLAAVGNPPITRWVYPSFEVYFEGNHVIHSVITRNRSQ